VIVAGLDGDYNPRRLERALVLAWDGGAQPVIVLNKSDLLGPDELAATVRATEDVAPGVSVLAMSAATGVGLGALENGLGPGRTAALIGSSGVGKSTLVNRLLGTERQRTNAVRTHDSRGPPHHHPSRAVASPLRRPPRRHPGLRELQLWAAPDALEGTFADVDALAAACRFADCGHAAEPGLRGDGGGGGRDPRPARLESYRKLQTRAAAPRPAPGRARQREQKQRWEGDPQGGRHHRPRE
jgi:ribosome biogenesis GTPase